MGRADIDAEPDPESVARTIALRLLEHRPRTRAELVTALAKRGVPDDAISTVLDRFIEVGLVNDAAFATAWVDSRHRGRGLGRRVLAAELRRRGVDDGLAADALSTVSADDEVVAARALVERRLRSMTTLADDVKRRRLAGMLARKGFGGSLAHRVISEALTSR